MVEIFGLLFFFLIHPSYLTLHILNFFFGLTSGGISRIEVCAAKLADRMRNKGSDLALHPRMDKHLALLPGLSPENDEMINNERKRRPELLTGRSNMTYHERMLAGLCLLNAMEVTR